MKHFWIALGPLVGLLAVSAAAQFVVTRIHEPIRETMDQAEPAVLAEDWDQAGKLIRQARSTWEKNRKIAAALSDHCTIAQMDSLFDRLELLEKLQDAAACAEACRELGGLSETEAEGQKLTWWNLL